MNIKSEKIILLVEDEVLIAIAKQRELEKYGYNVILADTGEKAVSRVEENREISLILMDIDLGPGMDGTETAEIILKTLEIPVVFLSSHMEPEIVEKTEKITSYGYVVKSSSITVLDASIKMAFKLFDANRKIEESDRRQKTMLSNISDVIGIMDSDGMMTYKSPNIEKWFGWKPEEIIGTSGFANVHPDDREKAYEVFESLLENDNSTATFKLQYQCKNGTYKPIELTAKNLVHDSLINGVLLNYRDITERLLNAKKIREKDSEFRKLSSSMPDMIYQFTRTVDGSYCVPFSSEGIRNVFGCAPEDVIDDFEPIGSVIHPEDYEKVLHEIEESASHLSDFSCEFRVQIPGKPVQWIFSRSAPEKLSDGSITWYGFNTNITDLKLTEKALRRNEEYLRVTLQSIGDAVITTDTIGKVTNMNHVAEKLTGWKLESASGKPFTDVFTIIDSKTRKTLDDPVGKVLKRGHSIGLANHTVLISRDRKEYQIADSASPIKDPHGATLGVVLVFRDVTEEYEIRKELQRSEKQYRLLFESTIEGICLHEIVYDDLNEAADYRILDANSSFENILNLKREDVIGRFGTDVYHTDEAPYLEVYAHVAETGTSDQFEVYFPPMEKYFLISVFSPEKKKFATIFEDITERKRLENELSNTVKDLKKSQQIAHVGSWRLNIATNEVTWTEELYKMYGFDPALPPPLYTEMDTIFTPESWEKLYTSLSKTVETGIPYELELETVKNDGSNGWMWVHGETERDAEGNIVTVTGAAQDITDRKKVIQEKDYLLTELNHRVKNNLLMISSLISLRNSSLQNEVDLSDIITQIDTIRIIHEMLLSQSENITDIDMRQYISELLDTVFSLNDEDIEIEKNIDEISIDTGTAIPIGLILNETATNAIKHGFTDNAGRRFIVDFKKDTSANQYLLTISNTGKPFPHDIDFNNLETLGLRLIAALVAQLNGNIELKRSPQTVFSIRFPIKNDNVAVSGSS